MEVFIITVEVYGRCENHEPHRFCIESMFPEEDGSQLSSGYTTVVPYRVQHIAKQCV
jgi:hypothetical protein